MTEMVCLHCGFNFLSPLTRVIKGRGRYCSSSCVSKATIISPNGMSTRAMRGEFTDVYRKNISRIHKKWAKDETKHPRWKAIGVGYGALHQWVGKHLGNPKRCEICGLSDPRRKYYWANKSKLYKRDLTDWLRLCCPCHRRYDDAGRKGSETRKANKLTKEQHKELMA